MSETLQMTTLLPASPQRIYEAWLNGRDHSRFTGRKATVVSRVGGAHTAWDGYIEGRTIALEPGRRIVQSWRTTEFPEGAPDSRLEIVLEGSDDETHLTLIHTDIPDGQAAQYRDGWRDYYFTPMRAFFEEEAHKAKRAPARKKAAKKPAKAAKKAAVKKVAVKKVAVKKVAVKKVAVKKVAVKKVAVKKVAVKKPAKVAPKKRAAKKPAAKAAKKSAAKKKPARKSKR